MAQWFVKHLNEKVVRLLTKYCLSEGRFRIRSWDVMAHVWRAILNTGKLAFRSRLEMPEGWDMHLQTRCCNANSAQHERKRRFRYLAYALGCIVSLCSIMAEERATIYWRFILRSVICYSFFSFSHRTNNILLHSNCARISNFQKPRPFFVYFRLSKTLMFPLGHISEVFKQYRFSSINYYLLYIFFIFILPASIACGQGVRY